MSNWTTVGKMIDAASLEGVPPGELERERQVAARKGSKRAGSRNTSLQPGAARCLSRKHREERLAASIGRAVGSLRGEVERLEAKLGEARQLMERGQLAGPAARARAETWEGAVRELTSATETDDRVLQQDVVQVVMQRLTPAERIRFSETCGPVRRAFLAGEPDKLWETRPNGLLTFCTALTGVLRVEPSVALDAWWGDEQPPVVARFKDQCRQHAVGRRDQGPRRNCPAAGGSAARCVRPAAVSRPRQPLRLLHIAVELVSCRTPRP